MLSCTSEAALATTSAYSSSANTLTVRTPSMTIQGGSWGTSSISLNDLASVTIPSPASAFYFVPVTLTNGQSSPTANPLQVMVSWNPSTYSSYEGTNLGNVRFCSDSACNSPLFAWLESCTPSCSASATSASAWVKLTSSIGANGGTLTIYLAFFAKGTSFDGGYWGEAPNLSGTYGQYDNGANVFTGYYRGDSTTGWTVAGTAGSTVSAPTGSAPSFGTRAFYAYSANGYYLDTNAGYSTTGNYIIQYYTYTTGLGNLFFSASSAGFGTMSRLDSRGGTDYAGFAEAASWTSWYCPQTTTALLASTWYQWSIVISGGGSQVGDYYSTSFGLGTLGTEINALGSTYTDGCGGGSETYSPQGSYIGLLGDALGSSYITYWNGVLIRAYPPNGVMPTSTFGSLTSAPYTYVASAYIPITLTNTQSSPTPSPFQEPITFVPSLYAPYEGSDLGNIRFCADAKCATMMYSWLESCTPSCSTSATSATVWVLLTSAIGASGGTQTIYMTFLPTSTEFDGVYAGEAPELSSTYAQYDNGANVFIEYNNGNSLFASSHTGTGGAGPSTTTTAPSPFTHAITGSVGGGSAAATTWTTNGNTGSPTLPSSYIAQTLVQITGSSPLVDLLTNVGSITTGSFYVFRFDARSGSPDLVGYYPPGAQTTTVISSSSVGSSTSTWYQLTAIDAADELSLYKASAGSTSNFATLGTAEVSSVSGQGYTGGGIAVTTDGASSTDYFTVIIVRAYPPGNVVPSAAFGSAVSSTNGVILSFTNTGTTSLLANLQLYSSTNAGRIYNLTFSFQGPYSKQVVIGTGVTNQNIGAQVTVAASATVQILLGVTANSAGTSTVTVGLKIQRPPATGQASAYCYDIIGVTVN